ncbi:hypothetical protein [Helicobacter sp. 23-1045]
MRRFRIKLRSMNPQVLSRLFHAKTAQSHTAITSIVDFTRFSESRVNLKHFVIARFCEAKSWQSKILRIR